MNVSHHRETIWGEGSGTPFHHVGPWNRIWGSGMLARALLSGLTIYILNHCISRKGKIEGSNRTPGVSHGDSLGTDSS